MSRRRLFFGALGVVSASLFGACDNGPFTTPPPAGYVPTYDNDAGASVGSEDASGAQGGNGDDSSTPPPSQDDSGNPPPTTGDSGGSDDSGNPPPPPPPSDGGALTGNGCAGGTCQNPTCQALGAPAAVGLYPLIGFETQPSYIPNDTIVPTFDDVPDGAISPPDPTYGSGSWTKLDLQFLAANNMHVDFFINTNNWCGDVTQDPECTADIVDILTLHNPANHTVYHPHMGTASTTTPPANPDGCADSASCEAELTGVETVINSMSNGGRPHLTRFRPPYGEPYQAQGAGLAVVEAAVAKYAVAVGWNLDSGDSAGGTYTGAQIAQNVENLIGSGPGQGSNWGIVLMHGTYPWTHDALPLLYGSSGYLATHGFKLATVEDVICWKYGKHSWEIVQELTGQSRSPN